MIDQKFMESIIFLLRRATGISYELKDINSDLMNKLIRVIDFKNPTPQVLKKVRKIVTEHYETLNITLMDSLQQVGQSVVLVEANLVPIKVTKRMVRQSLDNIMASTNVSTTELIKRTKGLTVNSTVNFAAQAYQNGWTNKQFIDALRTSEQQLNRHLEMISTTSVNAVSNHTKMELYKKNKDLVNRVLFSAHLDSRTSNICKALDGKVFKLKDAPVLPLHPHERSHLVPILKGEKVDDVLDQIAPRVSVIPKNKEVYDKQGLKTRTGKTRKPSSTNRSPLRSANTNARNYEEWLRKQPKYYQQDILGKKATKAFRKGGHIKDVVKLDPMTRKQLDKAIN